MNVLAEHSTVGELGESRSHSRMRDRALLAFVAVALLVRVLTDDSAPSSSRHTGSLNVSGIIALSFVVIAGLLVLRHRRGLVVAILSCVWIGTWTLIAFHTRGASTETLREPVRELSVLALAFIVYNARGGLELPLAARLLQLAGVVSAVIAIYQAAAGEGMRVAGNLRANGTFAHPNSAAMFFALAAAASMWLFLESRQRRLDLLAAIVFLAALVATYSIDGLLTAIVMQLALAALSMSRSPRERLIPCALAAIAAIAFFATPLGANRIAKETTTSLSTSEREEPNSTLSWRFHRWRLLLREWEGEPVLGRGLGITTTALPEVGSEFVGTLPHNEYLRYLVETGVVGLLLLLCGLALLLRGLLSPRAGPNGLSPPGIRALGLTFAIGCLVNSAADNTLLNSPTGYAAALVIGAVLAVPRVGEAKQTAMS